MKEKLREALWDELGGDEYNQRIARAFVTALGLTREMVDAPFYTSTTTKPSAWVTIEYVNGARDALTAIMDLAEEVDDG